MYYHVCKITFTFALYYCKCFLILATDSAQLVDTNPYNLEVGSVIQYGEPVQCGVIKWIGNLPNETEVNAGLEMVRHMEVHMKIIL